MGKKIAIVGTTISLKDAPYNDPSWEIWGLNGAYQAMPRWDRWFDMHDMDIIKKYHQPQYFDFLKLAGSKLTLNHKSEEYPEARIFPWQDLVAKYGDYFTNTVSWLIALAIDEMPDEIGLWGINMAQESEYGIQRPSCEFFLGIAQGKGIKITIPDSSELLKAPFLYGYQKVPAWIAKLPDKKREIEANFNKVGRDIDSCRGQKSFIHGYVQGTNDLMDFCKKELKEEDNTKVFEWVKAKHSEIKLKAEDLDLEANDLLHQQSYWKGACELMNYHHKNWSY
jgi:hypothetical protein